MAETTHVPRITNYEAEVFKLLQAESARRRNGGKGFSRTVNQIVLEWADAYKAGVVPLDVRDLQDPPSITKVLTAKAEQA